ncbi:NAD dependent epimerase/dehydratase [Apiospora aurea]|uniref:NAD dependent epimerase/dehydratase n=1 Tax=Apiospora aurea TaxID=335848 RepID=A0ABR1QPZ6_9PEZI
MGATASVPRDRTRQLQVIDAGYARTATLSYSLALARLLDGPVMHGGTQLFRRKDSYCRQLDALYRLRRGDSTTTANPRGAHERLLKTLRDVTEGFVACADCPLLHFLPELLELYPDAKVVLVTRDPASWWRSFGAFTQVDAVRGLAVRCLEVYLAPLPGARWFPSITRGFDDDLRMRHGLETPQPELLELHNAWVRRTVPKDRLLEVDMASGWGPLCEFLDKPVPDEPFPRVNDSKARDEFMRAVMWKAGISWIGIISVVAIGGVSVSRWLKRN